MNVGFKIIKLADDGFKLVKPIKMLSTGPIEADEEFSIQTDPQGRLLTACGVSLAPPTRRPINFRVPCKFHIEKMVPFVVTVPQEIAGTFIPTLLDRPLTRNGIYMPIEHREALIRNELLHGEMYRLARDLHRVDVKLSTIAGYNFELVMDAIANGATPVKFDNGTGVEMAAFFVIGADWVHTASSINGLYFGIGVVEASFIDFFKGVINPYIEREAYSA